MVPGTSEPLLEQGAAAAPAAVRPGGAVGRPHPLAALLAHATQVYAGLRMAQVMRVLSLGWIECAFQKKART